MGIFGIGVDIAHIPRFQAILSRVRDRFLSKLLHPKEISQFHSLIPLRQPQFVASRWAVKEAVVKSAGKRLLFPEMQIAKSLDPLDPRPHLVVEGATLAMFRQHSIQPHISLSHDTDYAIAYVLLETQELKTNT